MKIEPEGKPKPYYVLVEGKSPKDASRKFHRLYNYSPAKIANLNAVLEKKFRTKNLVELTDLEDALDSM